MSDKRKDDRIQITDRTREVDVNFESLMEDLKQQQREKYRRGRNKSKKRGRR